MLVAVGFRGVDARGQDGDVDARIFGIRLVEPDGAGKIDESASHLAEQVAHLEGDF